MGADLEEQYCRGPLVDNLFVFPFLVLCLLIKLSGFPSFTVVSQPVVLFLFFCCLLLPQ
jgi:hypothetical protein